MNWMQFVSTIVVFLGVPSIVVYGIHATRIIAQKLPEHTRLALEQFAGMAVQKVQQQYGEEDKAKKKMLAIQTVKTLFGAFRLPVPSDGALDIAVESAVFSLHKE